MTRRDLGDAGVFLREFARAPARTASLVPSSAALGELCATAVPEHGDPVIVELGAGTGTITTALAQRLGGRGFHLAVELNPSLAARAARRCPGVDVRCADATEVPQILAARGLVADVVVSALPWAAHRATRPRPLVAVLAAVLAREGVLVQIGYTVTQWAPQARRLRAELRAEFEEVVASPTVWRNVPPALTWTARRPRRPTA